MKVKLEVVAALAFAVLSIANSPCAGVSPGDTITKDQADKVADLVSPGNLILVKQGMTMKIVPTDRLEWPPPYKSATEKYSAQVQLAPDGTLKNYMAGLPFPLVDANDPNAALKVMWNFSYRPLYTDDAISKNVEIASFRPGSSPADPVAHFTIGNVGFYNNTGRTEVNPIPTNSEATTAGIRYRFGAYPFLDPSEVRGFGFIRYRNLDPKIEDNSWMMNPRTRHVNRASANELSDVLGLFEPGGNGGGGRRNLREQPRSRFVLRLRREDRRLQLQVSGREADARGCQRGELSRQGVPDGRRTNHLPGELGNAPPLRHRSGC